MFFFSADWHIIGIKTSLKEEIENVTRIPQKVLEGTSLDLFSIAPKDFVGIQTDDHTPRRQYLLSARCTQD
jgi:hypothetical protein